MPLVSLGLLALLAFGATVQVLVQGHRVGAARFRVLGDQRGSAEWWSGVLLVVAFISVVAAPILDLTGALPPVEVLDRTGAHVAGIVVWVLGAALARGTQLVMGRSWRIGVDPSERLDLVTTGPLRYVRHPIYTGLIMLFTGAALIVPNAVSLLSVVALVAAFEILVRKVEEPYLLATHTEYAAYRRRVGRFLPGIGTVG